MERKIIIYLFLLIGMFLCESFDYVYVDKKTFERQISYLENGFVAIVLQIDPTKKDTSTNYAAPGKIIKEKIYNNKTKTSSEMIQLILDITKRNQRHTGEGWYPTYKIYIKYTDRFLYFIPSEKYLSVIIDFRYSGIFIEGREFIFSAQEAKLLQDKIDYFLKN